MSFEYISIKGAREHNLQNIDIKIPRDKFVVVTGVSGSGKSSLAFDTVYAEGQRKYVESLSAYARQFLEQMQKPDVDSIEGLSPSISIEQRTASRNPRSTVGTVTEIYDYLRVLFARIGKPFCYKCGKPIQAQSVQQMTNALLELDAGTKINILAPLIRGRKGEYKKLINDLRKDGYVRIKLDGSVVSLSDDINLDKNIKHDIDLFIDRLVVKDGVKNRLVDSIELALGMTEGLVKVEVMREEGVNAKVEELVFSQHFSCIDCGVSYQEIEPRIFSFNNPHGACPDCLGLGFNMTFDRDLIVTDPTKSIIEGAIAIWAENVPDFYFQMIQSVAKHYKFSLDVPFKDLKKEHQDVIFNGSGGELISFTYSATDRQFSKKSHFEGLINWLNRRYKDTESDYIRNELEKYMSKNLCLTCNGQRLKQSSLSIKIGELNISEYCHLSIKDAYDFLDKLKLSKFDADIASKLMIEIRARLSFLLNVGLDYLSLSRSAATLSGGEGQRIRLATQIGSSLVGVLYILDEPSIGLHQKDNIKLIETLRSLKNLGNTVIVVEHDKDTIMSADHIIDMGPGAGKNGGKIVAEGTIEEILKVESSLTAQYLSGKKRILIPDKRRQGNGKFLEINGACLHNLKNVNMKLPCGTMICITGVSGSGKSSLILQTLFPAIKKSIYGGGESKKEASENKKLYSSIKGTNNFDKVIDIDQSPIGRTPRSNPATYSGLFTVLRELFATLPESKARGYKAGRFSFNVKGGRCETCDGDGVIRVEMHFLPDHYITCDVCGGKRYNRETLEIRYRGKNISEVLNMTVSEASQFFTSIGGIKSRLDTLQEVGLGYITLGQAATTLSGGEAQRLKLAKELAKMGTGQTLYILDEPTTGLHFEDIKKLLEVLHSLVDKGNTMIIIEHNLDVVKTADWLVDLGPDGGIKGGSIIAEGTPEAVALVKRSYTGAFLKTVLKE